MTLFSELSLRPEIQEALRRQNYVTPTPIQVQAIPPGLLGRDILGIAQTGTGKTAAFTLPILQRLSTLQAPAREDRTPVRPTGIRSLILTPTRELAIQIGESISAYGVGLRLRHTVIYGGVGQKPQVDALVRGVDIVVATPGRLLDLMSQGHVRLDRLEIFVLDEADRMLDMGFIRDVRKVVAKLPSKRQSMFFSATMPGEVADLAAKLLHDPVRVEVTPVATTADRIEQRVIFVPSAEKREVLIDLLHTDEAMTRAIVFTRTKHGANKVSQHLEKAGIRAAAIHGNKSQNARQAALEGFRAGNVRVLVATDIAARGIDIDDVSHVINFELPNEPENYVHRIGRTARAGASGIAVALCDEGDERAYLRGIEKLTRMKLAQIDRPPPRPVSEASLAEPAEQRTEPRRDQRPAPSRQHAGRPKRDGRKPPPMRADAQRPVQTSEGRGSRTGTPKSGAGNGRQANASFSGLVAAIGNNGTDRPAPRDDRSPRRPGGHRPGGHRRG